MKGEEKERREGEGEGEGEGGEAERLSSVPSLILPTCRETIETDRRKTDRERPTDRKKL